MQWLAMLQLRGERKKGAFFANLAFIKYTQHVFQYQVTTNQLTLMSESLEMMVEYGFLEKGR